MFTANHSNVVGCFALKFIDKIIQKLDNIFIIIRIRRKVKGSIMKKQKTLLIVVLIVAIAMVGLYLAMGLMSGKEEKTGDDVKAVPMLTDMEDVTYVQYKNVEGTVTLK